MSDRFAALKKQVPTSLSSVSAAKNTSGIDDCVRLARTWRNSRDVRDSYVTAANNVDHELALSPLDLPVEPPASADDQGKFGLYRLEVGCSPGSGKLEIARGIEGPMRESIQTAFAQPSGTEGQDEESASRWTRRISTSRPSTC